MRHVAIILLVASAAYPMIAGDKKKKAEYVAVRQMLDSISEDTFPKKGKWSQLDYQDANKHLQKFVGKRMKAQARGLRLSVKKSPNKIGVAGVCIVPPNGKFRGKSYSGIGYAMNFFLPESKKASCEKDSQRQEIRCNPLYQDRLNKNSEAQREVFSIAHWCEESNRQAD